MGNYNGVIMDKQNDLSDCPSIAPLLGIGEVTHIDTWVFYDQPLLFVAYTEEKKSFLVVAVDEDRKAKTDTWLYVELTGERIKSIKSAEIDLHDAFAKPSHEHAYIVVLEWRTTQYKDKTLMKRCEIPEDYLPLKGEFYP